jgi:hypothetical protein
MASNALTVTQNPDAMSLTQANEPAMDDDELLALIDEEIAVAVSFDNDPDHDARSVALAYYDADQAQMNKDVPYVDGWSRINARTVQETVDLALPGIMRVFDAPDVVGFLPRRPGDEENASQASEYLNYLWQNDINGYLVLYTAVHDALVVRNGIIKHYWDFTPEYCVEEMYGLDQGQFLSIATDPNVNLLGVQMREVNLGTDMETGQPLTINTFDVRVRRQESGGRLCVENVPPEDFGVSPEARGNLKKARCIWHRYVKTRSDLVKEGFDKDMVDEIPGGVGWSEARESRRNNGLGMVAQLSYGRGAMEEVEIYEVYVLADINGDGIAERLKCIVAGGLGGRKLLEKEEWPDDDMPFTDLAALPVPHRWMGRSIADNTMDLQRIATVFFRQFVDNLMQVNRPMREVVEKNIVLPTELLKPRPGQNVRVREAGSIRNLEVPFIGDKALAGLQYLEKVTTKRTGIGEATAALDETAIDPQTATAEQIQHDANYARTELMVRTMAKVGLRELFSSLLRLIVRHQDRPRTIRLNNEWKSFDPRPWNALMDVQVKVGLGTGSRERDLAMLGRVALQQDQVVQALGADNPVVPPSKWVATRHKMVQAAGLDDPDSYFTPVTDEDFAAWQQSKDQNKAPSPEQQKAEDQKAKHQAQLEMQGQAAQAKLAQEQQRMEIEAQGAAQKAMQDLEIKRQELLAKQQLERERMDAEMQLKAVEMQREAELKAMQILANQQQSAATAVAEPKQ